MVLNPWCNQAIATTAACLGRLVSALAGPQRCQGKFHHAILKGLRCSLSRVTLCWGSMQTLELHIEGNST